jgi:hypothetical protein
MSTAPPSGSVEGFIPLNGSAGNSAPITGGKRHHKLKLVTRKQARKLLKKMGKKMRGGDDQLGAIVKEDTENKGGRRHRTKKHSRRHSRRSVFGLKY